ncbi:MAG: glycoside hydrolase family protein [Chthoniobacterales bacterium]
MALQVPDEALALILRAEGLDQPSQWPGGSSGITIGVGYDLGFVTEDQFEEDWSPFLTSDEIDRLKDVIGLSGDKASQRAREFGDIRIKRPDAEQVFRERTLPLYSQRTEKAFPGLDQLPAAVQGALVSLVFNRGPGMNGDSRREMRTVRDAVADGDLQEIADQIRSMKRLWEGKNLGGLLKRRDAEADLVESAIDS